MWKRAHTHARMAVQRWARGVGHTVDYLCVLCPLCAYWIAVKIADTWLKFRAALSDRKARWRVPKRNGLVSLYADLERKIETGGTYGGQRAVFIVELERVEDELLVLQKADAAMRREEVSRTANRRREAVAATKEKLKVDEQHGCKR